LFFRQQKAGCLSRDNNVVTFGNPAVFWHSLDKRPAIFRPCLTTGLAFVIFAYFRFIKTAKWTLEHHAIDELVFGKLIVLPVKIISFDKKLTDYKIQE
jgi:hypothetical protein